MYGAFFKRRNLTKSCHEFWYMTFSSCIQFGQMRSIIKIIDYDNFTLTSQGPQPLLSEIKDVTVAIVHV